MKIEAMMPIKELVVEAILDKTKSQYENSYRMSCRIHPSAGGDGPLLHRLPSIAGLWPGESDRPNRRLIYAGHDSGCRSA